MSYGGASGRWALVLAEICDPENLDEDCNPDTFGVRDGDRDGYVDARCCNGTHCGEDCDDLQRGVNPEVPDPCDGIDNDCDGAIDEGGVVVYRDLDNDGRCEPLRSSRASPASSS